MDLDIERVVDRAVGDVWQWGVRCAWPTGPDVIMVRSTPAMAEHMAVYWNTRPDGPTCVVVRRRINVGDWEGL